MRTRNIVDHEAMFRLDLSVDADHLNRTAGVTGEVLPPEAFHNEPAVVYPVAIVNLTPSKHDFKAFPGKQEDPVVMRPEMVVSDEGITIVTETEIESNANAHPAIA